MRLRNLFGCLTLRRELAGCRQLRDTAYENLQLAQQRIKILQMEKTLLEYQLRVAQGKLPEPPRSGTES